MATRLKTLNGPLHTHDGARLFAVTHMPHATAEQQMEYGFNAMLLHPSATRLVAFFLLDSKEVRQ